MFKRLAFIAAGGYLFWNNRFRIQRVLESYGIKTPFFDRLNNNSGDSILSSVAKVTGRAEHGTDKLDDALKHTG